MDALAVAISSGIAIPNLRVRHAAKIALCFGLFQAIMPTTGYYLGVTVKDFISGIDHWIAFVLLALVGTKMIIEALKPDDEHNTQNPLHLLTLLTLGVATSIDALAAGFSFALLDMSILFPAIVIGVTTFTFSFAGVFIGNHAGRLFKNKMEFIGGLLLIGIGLKILFEHLWNN